MSINHPLYVLVVFYLLYVFLPSLLLLPLALSNFVLVPQRTCRSKGEKRRRGREEQAKERKRRSCHAKKSYTVYQSTSSTTKEMQARKKIASSKIEKATKKQREEGDADEEHIKGTKATIKRKTKRRRGRIELPPVPRSHELKPCPGTSLTHAGYPTKKGSQHLKTRALRAAKCSFSS